MSEPTLCWFHLSTDLIQPLLSFSFSSALLGQVRPSKRGVSKYQNALAVADSSGGPIPPLPRGLSGQTSMREIVFRPETTMQRIAPFDEESLRSAFTVEAGPVDDVSLNLLHLVGS